MPFPSPTHCPTGLPAALSRRALVGGALAGWLAGCAHARPRGEAGSPAALDHLYLVLDAESWQGLRAARELEALGAVDAGLPRFRPPGPEDHTVYLRGKHTYLELMGPQNAFGEPVGRVGVGLSVRRAGDLGLLEARARSAMAVERLHREVTWDVPTPQPWLDTLWFPALEGAAVGLWVSEYDPAFVPWLTLGRSGTRSEDFLALRHDPQRPLVDLRQVAVRAPAATSAVLHAVLSLAGWERGPGGAWSDGVSRLEVGPELPALTLGLELRAAVGPWRHGRCSLGPDKAGGALLTVET